MTTCNAFERSAKYYDLFYAEKDYALDAHVFTHAIGEKQNVLEFGAGTGKLTRALQDMGHGVTGVEPSRAMRLASEGVNLVDGTMQSYNHSGVITAVVAGFATFSYAAISNAVMRRCISNAFYHLGPYGKLAFDFVHYGAACSRLRKNDTRTIDTGDGGQLVRSTVKMFDPMTGLLTHNQHYHLSGS